MDPQTVAASLNSSAAKGTMTAEAGRAARKRRPRSDLADLGEDPGRDPVAITAADDADRIQELLPERYLRMSASAFTFYRGSAAVMAHDLGALPSTGIITQLCGDAHVANFGLFASPERELMFDLNDFDETSPGPFEWDVLRLTASVVLAVRELGAAATVAAQRRVAQAAAGGYQEAMKTLALEGELQAWYEHVSVQELMESTTSRSMRKRAEAMGEKAQTRDSASAVKKLTEVVDGQLRFREDPPLLIRLTSLDHDLLAHALATYGDTLQPDRRLLLERFELIDVARKVVGVGSVGTRCAIGLLVGRDNGEPLILQLKEAGASVLEPFTPPVTIEHHGARVVNGQQLMQAASDIFLGWSTGEDGHHFYWRQLRDMKYSPDLANAKLDALEVYSRACGRVLARAHARGGNRAAIAGYIGSGRQFCDGVTAFGVAYADRAEADFSLMEAARAEGRLP